MGIEIPLERVFIAQKMMITKCNLAGKPVIWYVCELGSYVKQETVTRSDTACFLILQRYPDVGIHDCKC